MTTETLDPKKDLHPFQDGAGDYVTVKDVVRENLIRE